MNIINKLSDALSSKARKKAKKSMANDDRNLAILKSRSAADKKNFTWTIRNGELNAAPRKKAAPKKFVPYYGKAGGTMSNGAGWGGERSSIKNKKDPMDMLRRGMQGKKR